MPDRTGTSPRRRPGWWRPAPARGDGPGRRPRSRGSTGRRRPAAPGCPARSASAPLGAEQPERAGVPMDEGGAADRADLAVAEEPADGNRADPLAEHLRVVIRAAVEVDAPSEAGEQHGAGRPPRARRR